MESPASPAPRSKKVLWTARVMSALPALLLLFSGGMKLAHPPQLDEGFKHLGIPITHAFGLGVLELACTVVYLIPRTSVLGAILLTAYLGGAIQTHVRVGDPYFTQIILGVLVWGGPYLRDTRLRSLLPLVR